MRIAILLTVLAALAVPAGAQTLPTRFAVTGVGSGDVLNVREAPGTRAPRIGQLLPDARGIEVVARDGDWGQINLGERAGWVSMRYLAPEPGVWPPRGLPPALACYGTEPFWSLRSDGERLFLASPDGEPRDFGPLVVLDAAIPDDPRRVVIAGVPERRLTVAMTPAACTDSMSDRAFGLDVSVVVEDGAGEPRLLTGCCSVDDRDGGPSDAPAE